jgi:signal recognition particle subunit SRP54
MMCGLQGSGKTTHSAKLAKYLVSIGKRPLLVACDVYRPAAIGQLQVVGEKAGVKVFEMGQISPVAIAKNALRHAKDYGNDVVILDTAGRLHIDETLMNELKDIKAETSPNEIMLVVDAMTGQDAVNVAKAFDEALGIDSVLMSKLDSDTRGGAALSVLAVIGKPVKFIGTGEKLEDLEPFHPSRMASRILGMGDVLTLIERAEQTVSEADAKKLAKKITSDGFDMNDLLDQMQQIKKMGPLKQIIGMIPGVAGKIDDEARESVKMERVSALIQSMTPDERAKPSIINPSRKRRIAAGSGNTVADVNRLIKQFEGMQKMMKQFGLGAGGKGGKGGKGSMGNMAKMARQMRKMNLPGGMGGMGGG